MKDTQDQQEINLSVWTPAANMSSLYWLYSHCIKYGQGPGKDQGSLLHLPLLLLVGAAFGIPTKPSSPGHVNPEQCVSQPYSPAFTLKATVSSVSVHPVDT